MAWHNWARQKRAWQDWWNWLLGRKPLTLGQRGEAAAADYMRRQGYKVVARGERDRLGEIDLIVVDLRKNQRSVVFVEVKTRATAAHGDPALAVDHQKQRRLTSACLRYMKRHRLLECRARFDVISVVWPEDAPAPTIQHLVNAFEPVGRGQLFS